MGQTVLKSLRLFALRHLFTSDVPRMIIINEIALIKDFPHEFTGIITPAWNSIKYSAFSIFNMFKHYIRADCKIMILLRSAVIVYSCVVGAKSSSMYSTSTPARILHLSLALNNFARPRFEHNFAIGSYDCAFLKHALNFLGTQSGIKGRIPVMSPKFIQNI